VILLVGPQEKPYGIQKDFLCVRSAHYRRHFEENPNDEAIEHIVKLPDASAEVFGLAQHFLYTGRVLPDAGTIPSYEVLVGVWKLGHQLEVEGLCDMTLHAMVECRRLTKRIPGTPLLVQVWKDTPEGSSIRKLLLSWTAEYMRSSEERTEFAKSLPQEVLSELVITMSSLDNLPAAETTPKEATPTATSLPRKIVHYLDGEDDDELDQGPDSKRNRRTSLPNGPIAQLERKLSTSARKPVAKPSVPKPPPKRRPSTIAISNATFSTDKKLYFCADLLTRMLSGPGTLSILSQYFSFILSSITFPQTS
jgi:hypothetical protein